MSYTYTYQAGTHAELAETVHLPCLRELRVDGNTAVKFTTKLDAPNLEASERLGSTSWLLQTTINSRSDPSQFPRLRSLDVDEPPE